MAQAAIPLMLAAGAVKGFASVQAGNAANAQARAQAAEEYRIGTDEQLRIRRAAREVMGRQLAEQGGSGFTMGSGSALGALEDSLTAREADLAMSRDNMEGKTQALYARGRQAARAGWIGAAAEMVGAAAMVGNYKRKLDQAGG